MDPLIKAFISIFFFMSALGTPLSVADYKIKKDFIKNRLHQDQANQVYRFELAQLFQDLNKFEKAISLYKQSKELEGELGWYSEYMIGKCYQALHQWSQAEKYYNKAFKRRPTRAEPLYDMANYHFAKKHFSKVCFLASLGKDIPYPKDDTFLVEEAEIYRYRFYELLSVAVYYDENYIHKAIDYIDELMLDRHAPSRVKANCWNNLYYYVENIPDAEFIPMEVTMPLLSDWSLERYKPCNPSIIKTPKGFMVNCRGVNYIQWSPHYVIIDGSGKTKSKNVFLKYDKDLVKSFECTIDESPSLAKYETATQGLEDLRLFKLHNYLYFTATSCQLTKQNLPKMCIGKLEQTKDHEHPIKINKAVLLKGPLKQRAEKNWMPFVKDNELYLIYSFAPYLIYKPDIFTGKCNEFINKDALYDFSRFAGSAPPIPFDDGYLLMVHEGIWLDRKYYLHRFVYLDKNLDIKKISRPFTFKHKGVEMCCGMVMNHAETKLIMTIALEDREAYFVLLEVNKVRSLLKDLPFEK